MNRPPWHTSAVQNGIPLGWITGLGMVADYAETDNRTCDWREFNRCRATWREWIPNTTSLSIVHCPMRPEFTQPFGKVQPPGPGDYTSTEGWSSSLQHPDFRVPTRPKRHLLEPRGLRQPRPSAGVPNFTRSNVKNGSPRCTVCEPCGLNYPEIGRSLNSRCSVTPYKPQQCSSLSIPPKTNGAPRNRDAPQTCTKPQLRARNADGV